MAENFSSRRMLLAICAIGAFAVLTSGAGASELDWVSVSTAVAGGGTAQCDGTVGGCGELLGEEFGLDSETNRRILATSSYISYGALQRNTVPCSRRGASYYNCQPGAQSNPYSRGCSTITRCRS